MNAATDSTRRLGISTAVDPAVLALDRYLDVASRIAKMTEAAGDVVSIESVIPEYRATLDAYRKAFGDLGEVRPTTWAGLRGLLQFLGDEVSDGGLELSDETHGRLILNLAAATRGNLT